MAKFHINKHGVPAPCRARSGNCPLGGEEQHFNNAEDAQKFADGQNEGEHGLLPPMKSTRSRDSMNLEAADLYRKVRFLRGEGELKASGKFEKELKVLESEFANTPKKTWEETRTLSYNGSRVAIARSNFVGGLTQGYKDEHIDSLIEDANMDSQKLADSFSNDKYVYGKWDVESESENKFTLKTEDAFGNEQFMTVKKEVIEEKIKPKGSSTAYSDKKIPMALSNYVHSVGSHQDSREYFQNIVDNSDMNSEKLVRSLNGDKNISGRWSIAEEDLQKMKLKNVDPFSNIDYVEISKGV